MPAIHSRASHDTLMIAPTLPSMFTQACLASIIEKNSYVAALPAPASVEPTRASLNNFLPMYGDNNIKIVLVWSGNEQKYKINAWYIMLQMSLIMRGISLDEFETIFDACISMFITCSGSVSAHDCSLIYLL